MHLFKRYLNIIVIFFLNYVLCSNLVHCLFRMLNAFEQKYFFKILGKFYIIGMWTGVIHSAIKTRGPGQTDIPGELVLIVSRLLH